MRTSKSILALGLALISQQAIALKELLNCEEYKGVSIQWEEKPKWLKKKDFEQHLHDAPKNPGKPSFMLEGKKGFLKGNAGTSDLVGFDEKTYLEMTGGGNLNLWKYLKDPSGGKYMISLKALESGGPVAFVTVYKCN